MKAGVSVWVGRGWGGVCVTKYDRVDRQILYFYRKMPGCLSDVVIFGGFRTVDSRTLDPKPERGPKCAPYGLPRKLP